MVTEVPGGARPAGAAYIADTVEDLGILAEADDGGDEKVSRFKARKVKEKRQKRKKPENRWTGI